MPGLDGFQESGPILHLLLPGYFIPEKYRPLPSPYKKPPEDGVGHRDLKRLLDFTAKSGPCPHFLDFFPDLKII